MSATFDTTPGYSGSAAGQAVSVTLSGILSDPAGNVVAHPTTRSDTA